MFDNFILKKNKNKRLWVKKSVAVYEELTNSNDNVIKTFL